VVNARAMKKGMIPNNRRISVHPGVEVNSIGTDPAAGSPVLAQIRGSRPPFRSSTVADARAMISPQST